MGTIKIYSNGAGEPIFSKSITEAIASKADAKLIQAAVNKAAMAHPSKGTNSVHYAEVALYRIYRQLTGKSLKLKKEFKLVIKDNKIMQVHVPSGKGFAYRATKAKALGSRLIAVLKNAKVAAAKKAKVSKVVSATKVVAPEKSK